MIEGGHADNRILECAVEVSAEYLVTGGICCPLRNIRVQESSTHPASCRSWEKTDTGLYLADFVR